jgi:DNA-binding response OmpR family regulator
MDSSGVCLILEDEPWTAFDLADYASFSGYELAGPFSTCRDALAYLENHTPTLAIIDIKVADGTSRSIIEKLTHKVVPFIIYSGYRRGHLISPDFASYAWIEKPARAEEILSAAERLLMPSCGTAFRNR